MITQEFEFELEQYVMDERGCIGAVSEIRWSKSGGIIYFVRFDPINTVGYEGDQLTGVKIVVDGFDSRKL